MVVDILTPWIELVAMVLAAGLGLIILSFPPRSIARVSFGVGMLLLGLEEALLLVGTQFPAIVSEAACREAATVVMAFVSPVWLLFSLHYARGERPHVAAGWKVMLPLAFALPLGALFAPGALLHVGGVVVAGDQAPFELEAKAFYLHCLALMTTVLTLLNLEQTFRGVTGTMRWRIKFLLLGLGILLLDRLLTSGWAMIQQEWVLSNDLVGSAALIAACGFILWSLARMGLSEVVVYPSRKVVLTAATTGLIVSYCLLVASAAWLVPEWTGRGVPSLPALIVAAGLLLMGVALLSDRFRQKAIVFLTRHFNRPQHDYRALWQTFTEQVASAADESEYCRLGTRFVSRTLNALSVTIWRVDALRNLSFGGSTVLTAESARRLLSVSAVPRELIDTLETREGVLDVDDAGTSWADARSRLFASQFREAGGHRLCVPLRAGGELVGLLLVGDRVGARPYSAEELDLLHTLAGEISRGLLNLRNAAQLAASRELEAFQTMSAFVVHDLKNTASTLSLTLQNFGQHLDNPAFREDALRSVSGCVSHINEVVTTLGVLRKEMEIKPLQEDLNTLVREALADLGGDQFLPVRCQLQETPPLLLDRVQMKKVLTNLLLNARDAIGDGGSVEVSTTLRNPTQVELAIRDNGCGMDGDYVRTKLFKPFHSTKTKGLGVGLFQAQKILEAHHGDIEVESTSGVGTVFRVLLPVGANAQ